MLRVSKISKVACLIAVIGLASFKAKGDDYIEKRKVITNSYSLLSTDKISLNNKFGEMKLVTWDKQEIKINVTIIAKTETDKRANEIFDAIVIESGKNNKGVSCFTKFKNNFDASHEVNKNEECTINYEVYLPADNPLFVNNEFGATVIPDYKGEAEIKSLHGFLSTGRISNAKEVSVEFGSAEIFHINNGHITIRYSKVEINKLSGNITATFEFADSVRISMDNDIKSMNIENTYSTLYLDLGGKFSAKFIITSKLNGVITRGDLKMEEEVIKPVIGETGKNPINHRYTVTVGSGERNININSKFGKVILGQYYVYHKTTTTTIKETKKTAKTTKQSN